MIIHPIKAFDDNYIWCIQDETEAIIVDPGTANGVLDYLEEKQLRLVAILLTHKHEDHTGGVLEIMARHPQSHIYGPKETEAFAKSVVEEGDTFNLLGHTLQVYETPGHTHGHISFLMGNNLFCGDALFSAGCGRVFTGDYEAQYETLKKFKRLNDDIKIYVGHEYTETNLRFASDMQPDNEKITKALEEVHELRSKEAPTLPTTLGREKEINLFLQAETLEDFIELRTARDNF